MPLFRLASLALLSRASAYIRTSTVAAGQDLETVSLEDAAKDLQEQHESFGDLQLVSSCCGEAQSDAVGLSGKFNLNEIYGDADELGDNVLVESACLPVAKKDYDQKADKKCSYVFVFENKEAPLNEYAANCIPAGICAQDVVGMTKGKIATYGVVLQILQQNLGKLVYLGEGAVDGCNEAMNKINRGLISDYFKTEPVFLFGSIPVGSAMKVEVDNMKKLDAAGSLGDCKKDDPSYGYLFVHENLYWSKKKGAVDLDEYAAYKAKKASEKAAATKAKEEKAQKEATDDEINDIKGSDNEFGSLSTAEEAKEDKEPEQAQPKAAPAVAAAPAPVAPPAPALPVMDVPAVPPPPAVADVAAAHADAIKKAEEAIKKAKKGKTADWTCIGCDSAPKEEAQEDKEPEEAEDKEPDAAVADVPAVPDMSFPDIPEVPDVPAVPDMSSLDVPEVPEVPDLPAVPTPAVPPPLAVPSLPDVAADHAAAIEKAEDAIEKAEKGKTAEWTCIGCDSEQAPTSSEETERRLSGSILV